jgi:hypothetical protein
MAPLMKTAFKKNALLNMERFRYFAAHTTTNVTHR